MLSRYSRQREQSLTFIVGVVSTMRESGVANSEWRVANREEKRPAVRYSLSATSTRPLIEQNRAHVRVLHAHATGLLDPQMDAAIDRGARPHGLEPALEAREIVQVLALTLKAAHPADAGHVGDRILAGEEFTAPKARVHDAVNAVHLVGETIDGILLIFRRGIMTEVHRLPRLGPQIGHLPIEPLLDLDAAALVPWIESAGLAAEILQDRAGLEDRDRPVARTVVVDDRRHPVVGRDRQELRL